MQGRIGPILERYSWLAAVVLAYETKGLLIGEAADPEVVAGVRRAVDADGKIVRVNEVLTTHLGPADVLVNVSIDFRDDLTAREVEAGRLRRSAGVRDRSGGQEPDQFCLPAETS